MNTLNWVREPFDGGCQYIDREVGVAVVGYYEWPDFEGDCSDWSVYWDKDDTHAEGFGTADAAMFFGEMLVAYREKRVV